MKYKNQNLIVITIVMSLFGIPYGLTISDIKTFVEGVETTKFDPLPPINHVLTIQYRLSEAATKIDVVIFKPRGGECKDNTINFICCRIKLCYMEP